MDSGLFVEIGIFLYNLRKVCKDEITNMIWKQHLLFIRKVSSV